MSALGQKQTYAVQKGMSALPPIADMCSATRDCPLWAKSGHQHYSITSLARASSEGGTVRLSAWAVLRLIANSNFVAA
jgi:hypothetical protein